VPCERRLSGGILFLLAGNVSESTGG